jgi:hypothetical protein
MKKTENISVFFHYEIHEKKKKNFMEMKFQEIK